MKGIFLNFVRVIICDFSFLDVVNTQLLGVSAWMLLF